MEYKIFDWAFNLWDKGRGGRVTSSETYLCEIGLVHMLT